MSLQTNLIKKIKTEFPQMRKPQDYAEVILEGVRLKAFDPKSSRKRDDFLKSGKIKEHVFVKSYTDLDLLVAIRNADRMPVFTSKRYGFIFSFARAQTILDYEKDALVSHIISEPNIKIHVTNALKRSPKSSITDIKNIMDIGDVLKQAGIYDKIYGNLINNGVKPRGYMWCGVRTIPRSHYHLSNKSKKLLQ